MSRAKKFIVGDWVRFRDDYDGTFSDFKGRKLTVSEVFPKDASTDGPTVKLKEIAEEAERYHLVGVGNLEPFN